MMQKKCLASRLGPAAVLGLALLGSAAPAAAQKATDPLTRFLNNLFDGDSDSRNAERPPDQNAIVPVQPPGSPTPGPAVGRSTTATVSPPLPPRRPANLGSPAPQPVAVAATSAAGSEPPAKPSGDVMALASAAPTTPAAALDRVNAYFNSIDTLTGRFVQYTADGKRAEGTIYVQRPGRLRFAYAPPSTLEIVADGRSVAVRDKKLGTNDVYAIGQTPLKFLLKDHFDIARDTKLRDVKLGQDGIVSITFDDSATIGGTSKVTLRFDTRNNTLKQWTVVDPQGYETSIALSDLNLTKQADSSPVN